MRKLKIKFPVFSSPTGPIACPPKQVIKRRVRLRRKKGLQKDMDYVLVGEDDHEKVLNLFLSFKGKGKMTAFPWANLSKSWKDKITNSSFFRGMSVVLFRKAVGMVQARDLEIMQYHEDYLLANSGTTYLVGLANQYKVLRDILGVKYWFEVRRGKMISQKMDGTIFAPAFYLIC